MTMSDTEKPDESGEFKLKTQSSEFNQKNDSVFSSLAFLEKKHEAYEKVRSRNDEREVMKPDPTVDRLIDDRSGRGGRGRGCHAGRGRRHAPYVPQYRREPKKWTMYDLSDVDPSLLTEGSNKTAALSFLSDLKKRKASDDTDSAGSSDSTESKVVFKKPRTVSTPGGASLDQQSSSCGKLVMPEFNFGVKKEKALKVKKGTGRVAAGAGIQLGHLNEEDEDDDG